jgi:hypothetical protein
MTVGAHVFRVSVLLAFGGFGGRVALADKLSDFQEAVKNDGTREGITRQIKDAIVPLARKLRDM